MYQDDIIITGKDDEEHKRSLEKVLQRIANCGLTVKKEKCVFMADSVEYLGFVIDKMDGMPPVKRLGQ